MNKIFSINKMINLALITVLIMTHVQNIVDLYFYRISSTAIKSFTDSFWECQIYFISIPSFHTLVSVVLH